MSSQPIEPSLTSSGKIARNVSKYFGQSLLSRVIYVHSCILYFCIISYFSKPEEVHGHTIYKKAFVKTYVIFAIVLLIFEGVVAHYFVSKWSEPIAYVLSFLNVYLIFFFWAQYRALKFTPVIITNQTLSLSTGLTSFCHIPFSEIMLLESSKVLSENIEKEMTFNAVVLDQQPQYLIKTKSLLPYQDFFSQKFANQFYINVDTPSLFYEELKAKLNQFQEMENHNGQSFKEH